MMGLYPNAVIPKITKEHSMIEVRLSTEPRDNTLITDRKSVV